jgi:predicted permease
MHTFLRRVRMFLRRNRLERELAEEMEAHRLLVAERMRQDGMDAAAANAASRRLMGNTTLAREEAREAWLAPWIESVWQDLRYAIRHLRAHPAFTLTAGLTLVLATALNTSFFTVFNAFVLRPWPVPDPDRVVLLNAQLVEDRSLSEFVLSDFEYFRDHARTTAMAAISVGGARVGSAPGPDFHFVPAGRVTAGFFEVLKVPMAIGRGFLREEDSLATPQRVVVIGAGLWQRAFGGDPQILGKNVYVNDEPMTVVGVTAPGLGGHWPFMSEVWIPMATALSIWRISGLGIAGRLQPGVDRDTATSELAVLMRQLDEAAKRKARTVFVTGTRPFERPGARDVVPYTLMLAALFTVLMLACANVSNLHLARALARQRELAIRLSIGAARGRVVRQLVTESLLLAGIAGAVAVGLSFVLPAAVFRAIGDLPPMPLTPDSAVLTYALIICGATTVATGLAPALRGTRHAAEFLKAQGGTISTTRPMLRAVLLTAQIALSAALLFAASLLTRGLLHATSADPGFQMDGMTVATTTLPAGAYDANRSAAFMSELKDALHSTGLGPFAFAQPMPLEASALIIRIRRPQDAPDDAKTVHFRPISAGAFGMLRIPLVDGRMFSEREGSREVVLNETFARTFWPGAKATGQQLVTDRSVVYTVTGVVRDVQYTGLGRIEPVLHLPPRLANVPPLLIRSRPADVEAPLRAIVQRLEPRAGVAVMPLTDVFRQSLLPAYGSVAISWLIGSLALLLAIGGVFGVFSYLVEERSREIGIRMALGARRRQVVALLFGTTRTSLVAGLVLATLLSFAAGRALRAFLYGLSPLDPLAYAGAAALLVLAAVAATIIPARRALRIDPVVAIRHE